jgi:hypothetical protein
MIKENDKKSRNDHQSYEFTLTGAELYYFSGIMHAPLLLGIEDPFLGFLADEMEAEMEIAKKYLLERKYIIEHDNQVVLNAAIAAILDTIFFPKIFLQLILSTETQCEEQYFYATANFFAKQLFDQEQSKIKKQQIHLIHGTPEKSAGLQWIYDYLELKHYSAIEIEPFIIDTVSLQNIIPVARSNGFQAAIDYLQENNKDYDASPITPFLKDIEKHIRNFSMSALKNKSEYENDYYNMAALEGENRYWKLMPLEINTEKIRISPINYDEITDWIQKMFTYV